MILLELFGEVFMKNVVVIGGGTGLSTLLRGLKLFPMNITAIVTVADDGSSTGRLREEFDIPAVGDLRNVLVSLSEVEPLVEELLQYRFNTYSDLDKHAFGNLIIIDPEPLNVTHLLVQFDVSKGCPFDVSKRPIYTDFAAQPVFVI